MALTAAAVLAAVIATTAADHGTPRVPPAGGSSGTPLSNQGDRAATHDVSIRSPGATHPTVAPGAPAPEQVAKPGTGPGAAPPPPANEHDNGQQKGKGKGGPKH